MGLVGGVLIQHVDPSGAGAGLTLTLVKTQFLRLLGSAGLEGVTTDGDVTLLQQLVSVLDPLNPNFPIVTP